jgi:methylmalonyl-CoA mutase cobalamin-binding subunit
MVQPHQPDRDDARRVYSCDEVAGLQIVWTSNYLRDMATADLHQPVHPVRFVTAASLFDGHDAAINIMRRILQAQGAEVIHLGHNRSVDEVVTRPRCQEDVQGVAISSYQGGHVEYFRYLVDRLRERGGGPRARSSAAAAG